MRLALGGAQLGMQYGIANASNEMSMDNVRDILNAAKNYKIDTIDTAIGYGNSEKYIGDSDILGFKIITKLPAVPKEKILDREWVSKQIDGSLSRLRISNLYGVMLHEPNQLINLNGEIIWNQLQMLKEDGVVSKVGYSIGNVLSLNNLLPKYIPDIIQVPFNVLDQRLLNSGWLKRLKDMGVEVHVRSIFLQGLLLMSMSKRPAKFNRWANTWKNWDEFLKINEISAHEACVNFALSKSGIDRVVVGVDSVKQLDDLLLAQKSKIIDFSQILPVDDLYLIDPSKWELL